VTRHYIEKCLSLKNHLKLTITDDILSYGFFVRLSDEKGNFMKDVQVEPKAVKQTGLILE
jgi:hypothetical protein